MFPTQAANPCLNNRVFPIGMNDSRQWPKAIKIAEVQFSAKFCWTWRSGVTRLKRYLILHFSQCLWEGIEAIKGFQEIQCHRGNPSSFVLYVLITDCISSLVSDKSRCGRRDSCTRTSHFPKICHLSTLKVQHYLTATNITKTEGVRQLITFVKKRQQQQMLELYWSNCLTTCHRTAIDIILLTLKKHNWSHWVCLHRIYIFSNRIFFCQKPTNMLF